MTDYTQGGERVDMVAPGDDIYSTVREKPYYRSLSGTSMASPYVAGAAGLIFSIHPEYSSKEVAHIIKKTATDTCQYRDTDKYGNRAFNAVNAGNAVRKTVLMERKKAYREVIENAEAKYGTYSLTQLQNISYAKGVCYLELRDINQDHKEELLVVYNQGNVDAFAKPTVDSYRYQLWTYEKGKAIELETDGLYYSNGGWPSICWTEYDGHTYLVTNYQNVNSAWFHGYGLDGTFGVQDEMISEYAGRNFVNYINGSQVESEEWRQEYQRRMEKSSSVNLFYSGGDMVYDKVKKVKEYLETAEY